MLGNPAGTEDVVLAARTLDMRRGAGGLVTLVAAGYPAEAGGSATGVQGLEFTAVEPDAEAHAAEVQANPSALLLAHFIRALRTDHSTPRAFHAAPRTIIAESGRIGP